MEKESLILAALIASILLIGIACPAQGAVTGLDPVWAGDPIAIEAEHYDSKTDAQGYSWTIGTTQAGYSADGYLEPLPDDFTIINDFTGPHADYEISLNTGTWYPWVRAWASNGNSDSLHIGLDGLANTSAKELVWPSQGSWIWNNELWDASRATLDVTVAGAHQLNMWMRESGIEVDCIVLASDPAYTPTGDCPPETQQVVIWAPPTLVQKDTGETMTISWAAQADASSYDVRILLEDGTYTTIQNTTQTSIDISAPKSRVSVVEIRAVSASGVSGWVSSIDPNHATIDGNAKSWIIVAKPTAPSAPYVQ